MNYTPYYANFNIMGKKPEQFAETVRFVASRLQNTNYAIRGTASLVLQKIDLNIDDIDVVGDAKMALSCNEIFKEYLTTPVAYSESPKFKSYFGQFEINGIKVEIMGDWQIKNHKGEWISVSVQRTQVDDIWLTTIDTELAMFAAMGRWTALQKIKRSMINTP